MLFSLIYISLTVASKLPHHVESIGSRRITAHKKGLRLVSISQVSTQMSDQFSVQPFSFQSISTNIILEYNEYRQSEVYFHPMHENIFIFKIRILNYVCVRTKLKTHVLLKLKVFTPVCTIFYQQFNFYQNSTLLLEIIPLN